MKTLKFRSHLAQLILKGEKTATWRLFDDKDLQQGDELQLIEWETGKEFGRAMITALYEKLLKDIREEDYVGHERFQDWDEMFETYRKYYGDRVTPETLVKIISLKLLD